MSVYTKLNQARADFHKLELKKSGLNKFAGYQYFELGDFLIPAMDVMQKNGLCAFISFGADLATMTITDVADPVSRSITITSPMSTCEMKGLHAVQQLGAVQTYLRRYLWVAALEIVEHDALDATTGQDTKKKSALEGIGDDLPADWKAYLKDLATELNNLVASGAINAAKERIEKEESEGNLDGDMRIYFERHMDSKTRSATSTRK